MTMAQPTIPVRHTKRMNARRLNQMNGDFLLQLKTNSVRSEFGQHVYGQNTAANREMKKKVGMWYKEQKHVLAKLNKGQGFVYKTLLRVHKEKMKLARTEDTNTNADANSDVKTRTKVSKKQTKTGTGDRNISSDKSGNEKETSVKQSRRQSTKYHDGLSLGNHSQTSEQIVSRHSKQENIKSTEYTKIHRRHSTENDHINAPSRIEDSEEIHIGAGIQKVEKDIGSSQFRQQKLPREDTEGIINQVKVHNAHAANMLDASPQRKTILQKTKVLEVRKADFKDPSTTIREENIAVEENAFQKDDSVLERYLREQALYTRDVDVEGAVVFGRCENSSSDVDANNNRTLGVHNVLAESCLQSDMKTNDGFIIETGKRRLSVHFSPQKDNEKIILPIQDEYSDKCEESRVSVDCSDADKDMIVKELHSDYLHRRNGERKDSLPPLKSSSGSIKHRIPPPASYLQTNKLRHSAPDPIDGASSSHKYFEFPRPTMKETLESWYDKKASKKGGRKGLKQRRPTLVELNNIYRQLKEMKKREILNEPFQIYRKNAKGEIVPSEMPHRRARFSVPSNRSRDKHRELLDEEAQKSRANRRKLDGFYQMLSDKEEEISHQSEEPYPSEEAESETQVMMESLPQYLLNVYNQIVIPEDLDPNSAEALNYCKYLRQYSPKSMQARTQYAGYNRRMSSWNPKGFIATNTGMLYSINECI